ncbi:carbonic anhydrase 13-like [Chiloscyllium plagiosum]|uniref:carbonic anhydrase 13-like n=1 Tax=Chiloscyllium plagiosum TaxID=36176 RepID=UPI001CB874E2|nr:carbonic anhydrase 13-like [Chiloscyllium plagiosum]
MAGCSWGYGPKNGPDHWHELGFPIAKEGTRQSPIEIKNAEAKFDQNLKPLNLSYDPTSSKSISNTGTTVQVDFDDCTDRSVLTGGPLCGKYRLRQLHFHWGACDTHGSEHVIDGKTFAGELHLVHWNAEKYCEFNEALKAPDGLAVIAVLLKVCEANQALQKIVCSLECLKSKGAKTDFKDFSACSLLPTCLQYWTYPGSLTTPPLCECVIWLVLKEPISVGADQLANFRKLEFGPCEPMQNNYRPPQASKCREIRKNFE